MITAGAWAGKRYAVYGLARSGLATVRALVASGAEVTAWDRSEDARAKAEGAALLDLDTADLSQFDSLVVSPGVPLNTHPIAARARAAGVEIIGDIELFARARPELPPHKVVGITGTNGKSTTTALVHHILETAGVPTTMGGNIGLPILAQDPLPEGGVYVLELSSYQIDLTQSLDCDVAVLLNITPDHLDRYASFEAYAASKARLFEMQSADQTALVDWSLFERGLVAPAAGFNGLTLPSGYDPGEWPALQGPHNEQNAAAAIETTAWLGLSEEAIAAGLRSYPGLPHRMERVREIGGTLFVNDSKATNAEAAAPALAAYPHIRWIVGGQAKTKELGDTAKHLDHVLRAYTIGEAGPLFARLLRERGVDVFESETLENAVKCSAEDSQPGEVVLLSPACASFDQFRDFEARGEAFKALVGAL
ncbi:Mur ligase family protein [Sphingomonas glaciei]|uniref:UDP-N-acetylmuramoylalanine--D-glutamate ligase n=1 Tax=Sphingomonas glaciei TaxID=2938948 RepID=A0ABY5MUU9_9SPHN|nr:UDP-N-acetylmuramoyl-L-alanine--D-glutamate ligase [Sphingomonas glaciei]UUR07754.1 Mur ligase family protein [Sphingomonas glaciei]